MKVVMIPLGLYQTNCYIIYDEESKGASIIDPGSEGEELISYIEEQGLQVESILLTHGHHDHIGAVQDLVDKYEVPVYIHPKDAEFLRNPRLNLSADSGVPLSFTLKEKHVVAGDTLKAGGVEFKVLETPGHTQGSISFYGNDIVFVGDALFKESIGRTDFPGGSYEQLLKSIETELYTLPPATLVCSGHGPTTSIAYEMKMNPFIRG